MWGHIPLLNTLSSSLLCIRCMRHTHYTAAEIETDHYLLLWVAKLKFTETLLIFAANPGDCIQMHYNTGMQTYAVYYFYFVQPAWRIYQVTLCKFSIILIEKVFNFYWSVFFFCSFSKSEFIKFTFMWALAVIIIIHIDLKPRSTSLTPPPPTNGWV